MRKSTKSERAAPLLRLSYERYRSLLAQSCGKSTKRLLERRLFNCVASETTKHTFWRRLPDLLVSQRSATRVDARLPGPELRVEPETDECHAHGKGEDDSLRGCGDVPILGKAGRKDLNVAARRQGVCEGRSICPRSACHRGESGSTSIVGRSSLGRESPKARGGRPSGRDLPAPPRITTPHQGVITRAAAGQAHRGVRAPSTAPPRSPSTPPPARGTRGTRFRAGRPRS